ncbi:MAG: electron transfer flavoprotein subunit beta/FixA family protein [Oligoflexia bacterium]|nr:electron transfer flavoprotein subunit beta/FixA family protein [Oligoflexia bacterium]
MNIIVCVKQVPDTETKIRVKSDGSGIETNDIKWVLNPYDEFAVEESLKLRDKLADGSTVTVITLGPKTRATEVLRTALAMGADNATLIDGPENLDSNAVAKALAETIKKDPFGVVFTGKQAIDDDCAQVSQLLAGYLNAPHSTVVIKFEISGDKSNVVVEREVEGGSKEVIELKVPAVVGANKGLNTPRYASLPGIMKAKKKEIKEIAYASLGLAATEVKISYKGFQLPPGRQAGKMLEGTASEQAVKLVQLLREESKVI